MELRYIAFTKKISRIGWGAFRHVSSLQCRGREQAMSRIDKYDSMLRERIPSGESDRLGSRTVSAQLLQKRALRLKKVSGGRRTGGWSIREGDDYPTCVHQGRVHRTPRDDDRTLNDARLHARNKCVLAVSCVCRNHAWYEKV